MMSTMMRKAVLAGLGARVVVNQWVDDLVKKGESAPDQEAVRAREFVDACEQSARALGAVVKDGACAVAKAIRPPGRTDVESLERKIAELAQKIESLSRRSPG